MLPIRTIVEPESLRALLAQVMRSGNSDAPRNILGGGPCKGLCFVDASLSRPCLCRVALRLSKMRGYLYTALSLGVRITWHRRRRACKTSPLCGYQIVDSGFPDTDSIAVGEIAGVKTSCLGIV